MVDSLIIISIVLVEELTTTFEDKFSNKCISQRNDEEKKKRKCPKKKDLKKSSYFSKYFGIKYRLVS